MKSNLIMLKSGLPIANWIREFCYSYDKWHNDCVQKFSSGPFVQEFYLLKEVEEDCAIFQVQPWKTNQGVD